MSSFISAAPVASGQVQSLDGLRAHALPSDAMIVASATQVNPANQNLGSYAIVESSGNFTIPTTGVTGSVPAVTQSPFADVYKEGSIYFNGTVGNYISNTATALMGTQWNTTGMTVEAWVNYPTFTGAGATPILIGGFTPTTSTYQWGFGVTTSGTVAFGYLTGTFNTIATTATVSTNTWNHIAFSCVPGGATANIYINGIQSATTSIAGGVLVNQTTLLTMGQQNSASPSLNAYVADVRITTGAALYTGSSFTVPSAPLSIAVTGTTQFLLRAGQNSPTIQNGALTFDRGLKQYMNFGPQTFNVVTQGFTAVWRGAFTGTAAAYERLFSLGVYGTNGLIEALRYINTQNIYWYINPSNASTGGGQLFFNIAFVQGTIYTLVFRYNPATQIMDVWTNGVQTGSTTVATATLVADRTLAVTYLGTSSMGMTSNTFAIYNRALSNVEIYNSYLALNTVPATPQQKTLEIGDINGTPALSVAGDGKVSVQSIGLSSNVLPWPPAAMTGYDTVINGGVYKARASTEYSSSYLAWYAFDKGNNSWITALVYNATTGVYTGSLTTTDVNGTVYPGEWLQVQIPSSVTLSSYSLTGGGTPTNPRVWAVLGSRDGINWFLVDSRNIGVGSFTGSSTLTYQVSGSQGFTFFRWVVIATSAGSYLQLTEWTLYGTADTSPTLTIAPATTFNTSVATPSLTGIAAAGVYAPQDFSTSGLNIPAYVVSNTATTANTVQYSSFGPFAGEGSLYFGYPPTTTLNQCGAYVNLGTTTPPNFTPVGTPLTIEGWIYITGISGDNNYYTLWTHGSPNSGVGSAYDLTSFVLNGTFYFGLGSGISPTSVSVGGIVYNAWNHVSGSWNGTNTLYASVNGGVASQAVTGTPGFNSAYSFLIGAQGGGYNMRGYVACTRITRGAALYTTTFTPPTGPLQPIQGVTQAGLPYGTVLLLRNAPAPGRIQTTKFSGANSGTVLSFPPAAMTGYATTLNAGYGQGTYVASASSDPVAAWYAFDKTLGSGSTGYWSSVTTVYAITTGAYTGSNVTVDVTGTSYAGEWLQIQMPSSIVLSTYSLQARSDYLYQNPSKFWILGSRDGTNWSLVDSRSGITWSLSQTQTFTVSSGQAFTYYRIVTNVINNTNVGTNPVSISEWTLNGSIEGVNVTADGRVGLGVVNPTRALEVAGDIVCTGTVSSGTGLMFRNRIINGDMRIWQRGTSFTASANTYTADRWVTPTNTVTTITATQSTNVPFRAGFQYSLSLATATTANSPLIEHRIEQFGTSDLYQGTPITISFWMRQTVGSSIPMNIEPLFPATINAFGTGLADACTPLLQQIIPSSNWQYYALTFCIAATGVATNGLSVQFWQQPSANPSTVLITGVQLEKGSVATPFEVRPYGVELQLCQRYYYTAYLQTVLATYGSAAYANFIYYKVPMRTNPVPTFSTNNFYPTAGGSAVAVAPSVYGNTTEGFSFNLAVTTYSWGNIGFAANAEL